MGHELQLAFHDHPETKKVTKKETKREKKRDHDYFKKKTETVITVEITGKRRP